MDERHIPKEKFAFVQKDERLHDKRPETKPVGYFKDAWRRFRKNKSAVAAFTLIMILALFAVIVPFVSNYTVTFRDGFYTNVLPRNSLFVNAGIRFWDGGKRSRETKDGYEYLCAIGRETGRDVVTRVYSESTDGRGNTYYDLRLDSYARVGFVYVNLSASEYDALLKYQAEKGVQIAYPIPATHNKTFVLGNNGANFWYQLKDTSQGSAGGAVLDENGNYIPNYLTTDDPEKQAIPEAASRATMEERTAIPGMCTR